MTAIVCIPWGSIINYRIFVSRTTGFEIHTCYHDRLWVINDFSPLIKIDIISYVVISEKI